MPAAKQVCVVIPRSSKWSIIWSLWAPVINLQEEQAAACFRHRVLIPWCSLPGVTLSMNSPWEMPKTNLVPLWRTPLYVTIKVVSLMPCSCWRSCKALWLSQTGFSTFFLPLWCFPLLSLYYCFLFLSVNAEECYPVLWNRCCLPSLGSYILLLI